MEMCHSMAATMASTYYCKETAAVGLGSGSYGALLQLFLFSSLQNQRKARCPWRGDFPLMDPVTDQTAVEGRDGLHHLQNMGKFLFQSKLQSLLVGTVE